jgi:Xaa-Pro aminopeptidase
VSSNPFGNVTEVQPSEFRIPTRLYPLGFSETEYNDRLTRCREEMANQGVDLLYVTSPEGMFYLHGYEVSWYRAASSRKWFPATATVVHVDHDYVILLDGEDPVPAAVNERRALDLSSPKAAADSAVKVLKDQGWLRNNIVVGLEYWSYTPPRAVSTIFENAFDQAGHKVVDGSDVLRMVRQIKSSAEIAVVEHAARIGDIGLKAVADHFKPGMTHGEVFAEVSYAMLNSGGEVAGIHQAVQPGWPQSTHLPPSRRQISPGEPFAVDVVGVYHRYHANIDRTFIWGEPSTELLRMHQSAKQALEVYAEVAIAGKSVKEVAKVMRQHYIDTDIWQFHNYCGGYELGIAFPPDWVGEFEWSVAEEDEEGVFQANMITNYENTFRNEDPAFEFAQIAFSRDTLVYNDNAARRLSGIPVELIVLGG